MVNNIVMLLVLWLIEKLAEAVVNKLVDTALCDRNLKRLTSWIKIKILVLYLDWLLQFAYINQYQSKSKRIKFCTYENQQGFYFRMVLKSNKL